MAATTLYGPFLVKALLGELDLLDGNVKLALLDSGHTPDLDADDYFDDVDADEVVGTGYTADGKAVTNPALSYIDDASAVSWAVGTAYDVGDIVRPSSANGHVYVCAVAGTSHASVEPTWPTTRAGTVTDNGITWAEVGKGYIKFDFDDVQWTSSTISADYGCLQYDTGTASTSPLIALIDFGSTQSSVSGTFTVSPDALGSVLIPVI